jgi:hypothetical protein
MPERVLVLARDLMFRSKLRAVIAARGAEVAADESACDRAMVEIDAPDWEARIRTLAGRGIPVLAFGSHVHADLLRRAREAGAQAVPNSQVERVLGDLIG